ncbi:MAG: pirin family protein [Burkholderiales bacterium]
MSESVVRGVLPLGFPWQTVDPFLFCVHHLDLYPPGNDAMGPAAPLAGRDIGMDFEGKDGWRMYHGDVVPGFPRHPHRGFETVTLARHGFIDHSDSLGATARFGQGDVQWMTAGRGVVHSEMFPLRERERGNRAELFQIWLNLPRASKMAAPYFTMLWSRDVPEHVLRDDSGRETRVVTVAGPLAGRTPPSPPPDSWASRSDSDVAIWTLTLAPGARFRLPPAAAGTRRTLYFFRGASVQLADHSQKLHAGLELAAEREVVIENGPAESEMLMLQGRPIGEPVVQHGPFVMNTRPEILQAFADFQETGFGGWPWPSDGPVHPRERSRFAIHADGRVEQPDEKIPAAQALE